nr:hypothetical protein [Mesorhizobium loti]
MDTIPQKPQQSRDNRQDHSRADLAGDTGEGLTKIPEKAEILARLELMFWLVDTQARGGQFLADRFLDDTLQADCEQRGLQRQCKAMSL